MSSIGPQLPPNLQKRKRSDDEDDGNTSDSSTGPAPPPKPKETSPSVAKRARVIGPAPPPAPLAERPATDPEPSSEEGSESDDDDFGPMLPSAADNAVEASTKSPIGTQSGENAVPGAPAQRDEWMTMAPTNGDWSSRVDPTKLKNRKFNTGRGAKAPSQAVGGDASWYETPEQKQERLKREVMGIKDAATSSKSGSGQSTKAHDNATARRLKEYSTTQRGPSLYASHNASQEKPVDDDPSARAFDREKDIGSGSAISATKRREMVKKSADFSSKFEKARYL
ncbi:hypothetical protein H2200_001360 [Cladophialophora chaetospira]|uniref:DUF3752 domain-containing protein n=1 Tax=Cladophialophora chaetospira TaxID=386627 RepID=A0AA38XL07_9EURO|nr:hypothetical protein H2200_001360 [Cladophialophora chaetospira]